MVASVLALLTEAQALPAWIEPVGGGAALGLLFWFMWQMLQSNKQLVLSVQKLIEVSERNGQRVETAIDEMEKTTAEAARSRQVFEYVHNVPPASIQHPAGRNHVSA